MYADAFYAQVRWNYVRAADHHKLATAMQKRGFFISNIVSRNGMRGVNESSSSRAIPITSRHYDSTYRACVVTWALMNNADVEN